MPRTQAVCPVPAEWKWDGLWTPHVGLHFVSSRVSFHMALVGLSQLLPVLSLLRVSCLRLPEKLMLGLGLRFGKCRRAGKSGDVFLLKARRSPCRYHAAERDGSPHPFCESAGWALATPSPGLHSGAVLAERDQAPGPSSGVLGFPS